MQANPFGNAKPVDTVAKLKELEERDAKRKVMLPLLHASLIPCLVLYGGDAVCLAVHTAECRGTLTWKNRQGQLVLHALLAKCQCQKAQLLTALVVHT